jgi:exopolysaccharide production protein ExoZ
MFFYGIFGLTLALPQRLRVPAMSLFLLAMVSAGYLLEPLVSAAQSVYFSPLLLEFLLGVWIGSLWLQGQIVLPLGVSVVLIFGGAMLLVSGDALQWGGGGAGFGATCVVLGALNARISQWRSALFRALGDSSYSLYLTHIFTLGKVCKTHPVDG